MDKLVQQSQNFRIAYAEALVGQSGIFRTVKVLVPIECKHANAIFWLSTHAEIKYGSLYKITLLKQLKKHKDH